jgi:voltage-gated potassium channel
VVLGSRGPGRHRHSPPHGHRGARDPRPSLTAADWAIWGIFAIEYVVLLATAPSRRAFVTRNWLTLVIVVVSFPLLPAVLDLARVARLARAVRLLRLLRLGAVAMVARPALKATLGRRVFLYLAVSTVILILAAAALMTDLEPITVHGDYWSGVWWAIITVTTVGLSPISTLTATISAYLVESDHRQESTEHAQLVRRLERMEGMLKEALTRDQPPAAHRPQIATS